MAAKRESFFRKFSRNLIWIYIITFAASIFGYLIRILFSKRLTVAEFGLFYSVFAFVFFFEPIREMGLTNACIYYINKYAAKKKRSLIKSTILISFFPQAIMSVIIAAALFFLRNFLSVHYFHDSLAVPILMILLLYYFVEIFLPLIFQFFVISQDYILLQIHNPIKVLLVLLASLLFFKMGFGFKTPALAYLASFFFLAIIFGSVIFIRYKDILREKFVFKKEIVKNLFAFGLPLVFSNTVNTLLAYSDIILLTLFQGVTNVGYYNVALPSASIILIFIAPLEALLFPILSREWHHKRLKNISKILSLVYSNILFFALPLALIFFCFPGEIITILFDAKYLPAATSIKIFAGFFIFQSFRMINFAVMAAMGMPKQISKIVIVGGLFNFLIDLYIIPRYNIAGAAFTTGLGHLIMAIWASVIIYKNIKFTIKFSDQLKIILSSGIMLAAIILLKRVISLPMIAEVIVVAGSSILLYAAACLAFGIISKERIREARKFFGI